MMAINFKSYLKYKYLKFNWNCIIRFKYNLNGIINVLLDFKFKCIVRFKYNWNGII
jgi:hypothetical protein